MPTSGAMATLSEQVAPVAPNSQVPSSSPTASSGGEPLAPGNASRPRDQELIDELDKIIDSSVFPTKGKLYDQFRRSKEGRASQAMAVDDAARRAFRLDWAVKLKESTMIRSRNQTTSFSQRDSNDGSYKSEAVILLEQRAANANGEIINKTAHTECQRFFEKCREKGPPSTRENADFGDRWV